MDMKRILIAALVNTPAIEYTSEKISLASSGEYVFFALLKKCAYIPLTSLSFPSESI